MVARPKARVATFGVGSFNFVYKDFNFDLDKFDQYHTDIVRFLEQIDNISNIETRGLNSLVNFPTSHTPQHGYSNCPFEPCFGDGEIKFNLFIPERLQKELSYDETDRPRSEKIFVSINYNHSFPVALIEPLNPTEIDLTHGASRYVMIVREFFYKKQSELNTDLKFACLGPSPFHADFFITTEPRETSDSNNFPEIEKELGYDKIRFFVDPKDWNIGSDIAKEIVISNLSRYYTIIYSRLEMSELESNIFSNLEKLVAKFGRGSWRERLGAAFGPSARRLLLDIHLDVIEIEKTIIGLRQSLETEKSKLTGEHLASGLFDYADEAQRELPGDVSRQIENVTRLVQGFETSRSNNEAIFVAAAVSSVATAILTSLVQGG